MPVFRMGAVMAYDKGRAIGEGGHKVIGRSGDNRRIVIYPADFTGRRIGIGCMKQLKQRTGFVTQALRLIVPWAESYIIDSSFAMGLFHTNHLTATFRHYLTADRLDRIDSVYQEIGENRLRRHLRQAGTESYHFPRCYFPGKTVVLILYASEVLPFLGTFFPVRIEQGRHTEPENLPAVLDKLSEQFEQALLYHRFKWNHDRTIIFIPDFNFALRQNFSQLHQFGCCQVIGIPILRHPAAKAFLYGDQT